MKPNELHGGIWASISASSATFSFLHPSQRAQISRRLENFPLANEDDSNEAEFPSSFSRHKKTLK